MSTPLIADQLPRLCRAAAQTIQFEVVASTGSTNADLRERLPGLAQPVLRVAEHQTAGRGRAGRSWVDARGDNLSFSLAWHFGGEMGQVAGLSLVVGVLIAETLRASGWEAGLKWPNDVLLNSRKLGGILIETVSARPGTWAIIGVGINVHANAERDAAAGTETASLAPSGVDRHALLASLADGLAEGLPLFDAQGLAPFVPRWQALHAYAGEAVDLIERGTLLQRGIARGIDDMGCLLLDTHAGRIAVLAGDISLRKQLAPGTSHALAD
ncbi:MAG: biotin--[acetyl-CoA-carboxylase] ligase [Oxalobacteraceae bacterium]|nr:biotin--[acetyl-CoA-carboxylase] ligase [Oxalobacteraceae bacterium]